MERYLIIILLISLVILFGCKEFGSNQASDIKGIVLKTDHDQYNLNDKIVLSITNNFDYGIKVYVDYINVLKKEGGNFGLIGRVTGSCEECKECPSSPRAINLVKNEEYQTEISEVFLYCSNGGTHRSGIILMKGTYKFMIKHDWYNETNRLNIAEVYSNEFVIS